MEELKKKLKDIYLNSNRDRLKDFIGSGISYGEYLELAQPYLPEEDRGHVHLNTKAGQMGSDIIADGLIKEWGESII